MKYKKFVLYGVFSGQLFDSDTVEETYKAYLQLKKNDKENNVKEKYFFMLIENGEAKNKSNYHLKDIKTPIRIYRKGEKVYYCIIEEQDYHKDLKSFKKYVIPHEPIPWL